MGRPGNEREKWGGETHHGTSRHPASLQPTPYTSGSNKITPPSRVLAAI